MNYHAFAVYGLLVTIVTRVILGLPDDWAAWLVVIVGFVGAYALFYHLIKFIDEKIQEYGLVWRGFR